MDYESTSICIVNTSIASTYTHCQLNQDNETQLEYIASARYLSNKWMGLRWPSFVLFGLDVVTMALLLLLAGRSNHTDEIENNVNNKTKEECMAEIAKRQGEAAAARLSAI